MIRVSAKIRKLPLDARDNVVTFINRELLPVVRELVTRFNARTGDVQSEDADYAMLNTDRGVVADCTSGNVEVTLPSSPECVPWVLRSDGSGNDVTVVAPSGQSILGYASGYVISTQYGAAAFDFADDVWYVVGTK